jgi:hypothetical protein
MFRAGKLTCLAVGTAGLGVTFAMLAHGTAMAATGSGGPISFAIMAAQATTVTSTYSCDLSGFGTGIQPVTVDATVSVPRSVEALTPLDVTLTTTKVTLPSTVLSKLTGVVSFDLAATVKAKEDGASASFPLSGQEAVSGTLTGLPAVSAKPESSNPIGFPLTGTGQIEVPVPNLTFTPSTSGGTLQAITCTTTAATRDISVKVTALTFGSKGPQYQCSDSDGTVSVPILARLPMTVTSSGTRTTGKTDTVTLAIDVAGLLTPPAPTENSVSFSGDLPVTGAQSGTITLATRTTDVSSTTFRVAGKLALTKAGTDHILAPDKFKFTLNPLGIALTCTIKKSPPPVGLTVTVTAAPSASPSPTVSSTSNGGQPEGSGTPAGAPATGGGTGPGADMAVAAGGAAIAFSGGGLVIFGRRRGRRARTENRA